MLVLLLLALGTRPLLLAAATNASALLQNTSTATTVYPTFTTSSANGNSSAVINTAISANLGNASITATTFVGALSGAATTAGTVTTAAQPNITSVGTLTSLSVTGNISAGNVSATTFTGALTGAATTAGTVTTAAQGNITSVGTLTGLTTSGSITGNAVNAGIEWGSPGTVNTPYIDFHSSGNASRDYDVRLISSGGNVGGLDGTGNLQIIASLADFSGTVKTTTLTTGSNVTAGTVTGNWTLTAGSRMQATYADIAEKYVADATYVPGTVLAFGGEFEVTLANTFDSTTVAGVVTTNPAYSMNAMLEAEYVAEIALQGRVPCKVLGPIEKGDLMVSASNGHATANNDARAGTIIGKALENFNGDFGVIEVAVGRF